MSRNCEAEKEATGGQGHAGGESVQSRTVWDLRIGPFSASPGSDFPTPITCNSAAKAKSPCSWGTLVVPGKSTRAHHSPQLMIDGVVYRNPSPWSLGWERAGKCIVCRSSVPRGPVTKTVSCLVALPLLASFLFLLLHSCAGISWDPHPGTLKPWSPFWEN